MDFILFVFFYEGPTLAAFLFGCIAASIAGKKLYIRSGKRALSGLFAASLFLVLFYILNFAFSFAMSSAFFNSPESGDLQAVLIYVFGVYFFAFAWAIKILGVFIPVVYVYRLKRTVISTPEITQAPLPTTHQILIPVVALLAVATLIRPVGSLFQLYQNNQHDKQTLALVKENEQTYESTIGPQIKGNLATVQVAIAAYEKVNGKPPEELNQLVPKYLTVMPLLPSDTSLGGPYSFDYAITDPMRNYYRVCILAGKFEAGLTGRACTDETGRSPGQY
jgi:NADH:ubiquinone oxidoreductase subunit 6 (subunit J)